MSRTQEALRIEELIDLLIAKSAALRASGFKRIRVEGIEADLDYPEEEDGEDQASGDPAPRDAWHDPESFPGGFVPSFRRRRREEPRR